MTDAIAKKVDFYKVNKYPRGDIRRSEPKKYVMVHKGFKTNFENVWFGQKGILNHLEHPEKMRKDYAYDTPRSEQDIEDEQNKLEAIYICGHR
jgi:hypothetical protein